MLFIISRENILYTIGDVTKPKFSFIVKSTYLFCKQLTSAKKLIGKLAF